MKTAPSLMTRIVRRLSLTTLGAIVVAYALFWWKFESTAGNMRDRSLLEGARSVAAAIKAQPDGTLKLDMSAKMRDGYERSSGSHGFSVRRLSDGKLLFSLGAETGPMPADPTDFEDGTLYQYNPDGPGPDSYYGEALPFKVGKQVVVIQVVQKSSDYQSLIETVLEDAFDDGGWLAGPFLLALLVVSIATVRGTLRPIRDLSERVEGIGPSSTDVRLPLEGVPREIGPLVRAVNLAFERLDEGFRLQREFTADAAHELRTPLAILRAHADTLADRDAAKALREDIDNMSSLVEQLLRIASLDTLVLTDGERVDLCALARDVVTYLARVAVRAGRDLAVEAPDEEVWVHGQQEALFHAVRNLVENAIRFTPAGTTVVITVTASPLELTVRDFGPGVPADQRKAIFRRFWRSERRAGAGGLGLSIVQRTMSIHGGSVTYEDAEGGGALFRLSFPGT